MQTGCLSPPGGSASTIVEIYSTSGYTISEQGTFANGTVGLSNFAYIQTQARQQSTTASAGGLQTFSGTDDVGQGANNPTFTGTGVNTVTYQNDQSNSCTLSQYGAFTGGAFSLGTVTYAGSSSNSFTASDVNASSWTGGYSGNETVAKADSSSDVQNVTATGSFAGGSWSLSSYVLQGSAQQADSSSTTRYQSVGTMGFSGSTYAISDASTGSSTLYQSGTQSAGTYANASYAYFDGSVATLAAIAQAMGVTSGDTRTETAGSTIILGGTQQVGSAATYSYNGGSGPTSLHNSGSQASDQPTADPVVQFGMPDASMVASAGVGQLVGVAQTQSSAMPVAAAQPAAGYLTPGATAPVPMSVNMRAVAATADWSDATVYASQRAVANWSRQMTLHGFQPASGPAVEALMGRAAGASFGLLAWKALEPALKAAQWGQATAASGPILQLLLLDDESGELAQYIFGQMGFTSNSSDPLVREIDKMLYNNGQPLTAGSAPLYGTYFDPRALAQVQLFNDLVGGADGVASYMNNPLSFSLNSAVDLLGGAVKSGVAWVDRIGDNVATLAGPSSMDGVSAQEALSKIGPFIQAGLTLYQMVGDSLEAGVQPLRNGPPGVGRPGRGLSVCRDAPRRAIGQRPQDACFSGRMLIDVLGGKKRANLVRRGDLVASRSEFDPHALVEYKVVEEVFVNIAALWNLKVAGTLIETTGLHPFYGNW